MSKDLIYPAYLSEQTIQTLFEQIPPKILKSIVKDLGIEIQLPGPLGIKFTKKISSENKQTLIAKAQAVATYIEKHHPEQIGSIDEPRKYIKGTLKMFAHFLPQAFGTKEDAKPELIYYGGSTEHTILGLAGAASYVHSPTQDPMSLVSSALPDLMSVLLKEFKLISANPRFKPIRHWPKQARREAGHALECIEYMNEYNGPPVQIFSFFAKTKLDSESRTLVLVSSILPPAWQDQCNTSSCFLLTREKDVHPGTPYLPSVCGGASMYEPASGQKRILPRTNSHDGMANFLIGEKRCASRAFPTAL